MTVIPILEYGDGNETEFWHQLSNYKKGAVIIVMHDNDPRLIKPHQSVALQKTYSVDIIQVRNVGVFWYFVDAFRVAELYTEMPDLCKELT